MITQLTEQYHRQFYKNILEALALAADFAKVLNAPALRDTLDVATQETGALMDKADNLMEMYRAGNKENMTLRLDLESVRKQLRSANRKRNATTSNRSTKSNSVRPRK